MQKRKRQESFMHYTSVQLFCSRLLREYTTVGVLLLLESTPSSATVEDAQDGLTSTLQPQRSPVQPEQ